MTHAALGAVQRNLHVESAEAVRVVDVSYAFIDPRVRYA